MTAMSYPLRIIVAFAALGAVSGGIGALTWPLLPSPAVFYGVPSEVAMSWSPAIAFAIALAVGTYAMVTKRIAPIAAMMGATIVGWWIAVEVAALPNTSLDDSIVGMLPWLGAGFVGALALAVTGAIVGVFDRSFASIGEIAAVGAVAVLVSLWVPQTHFWLLLTTWQAAVGAAIGHAIVRSQQTTMARSEPRAAI